MKDNIALIVSNKDVKKIRELFNENYPIDIALALEEVDDDVLKEFHVLYLKYQISFNLRSC